MTAKPLAGKYDWYSNFYPVRERGVITYAKKWANRMKEVLTRTRADGLKSN